MKKHNCEECKLRAKHDKNPNSFAGKFWRWHIKWCPAWNSYVKSLDDSTKKELKAKYQLN